MTAPFHPASKFQSRRALLAGALGGVGAWAATAVARVSPTHAAIGDPLILGSTANNAGSDNTTLTTSSSGTALLVTQNGSGTALRGSAVGPGSIAGFFTAQNGTGISGVTGNPSSYGVFGQNNGAAGTAGAIRAAGGDNHGLVATTANGAKAAIEASHTGDQSTGAAIRASGGNNTGLRATSDSKAGVLGESASSYGIFGLSSSWYGVNAYSSNSIGIYADSGASYAGWFDADTHVNGTLTKALGAFRIDHPLDPANQYLQHSFVESPEMKNVYDGLVTLDAKGEAKVALPTWFEALNRDMRYQLTAVGAAAPDLHVKAKLAKGRFVIGGGSAGLEVCWQVTGIRHDPYAEAHPIVVEQPKGAAEKGKYLHPELYGQPRSKAMQPRIDHTAPAVPTD